MENPGWERNGERSRMAQHAILRFEKHKGNPARPLEAHHERQKEQYASNPDIDTSRSKYNFHIVKPEERYYHFIQNRIEQAGCRTRKDSTRFVDTLVTASPEFFKGKSPKEIQAFFQRAADFLIGRVGRENIVSAVVHMDEKTPHLHLTFVPLTKDNRLCAREIIGNRASLTEWQDDFHAYMVEKYPDLERGESASRTGRKHMDCYRETLAQLVSYDLLVIDDFGLMQLDLNKCRNLFEVLECRDPGKSTMVVSQFPVKSWYDLFQEHTYADACLNRMLNNAYRLEMNGKNMRNLNPVTP